MVAHTHHTVKHSVLPLLVVILGGLFCYALPTVAHGAWSVQYLQTTVTNNGTGLASTSIEFPPSIVGSSQYAEYYLKELPTDNNYYNITNSIQCYPRNGGSGAFASSTVINQKASVTQTSNTSGGSPACNVSGTYYHIFRDATASSSILYVSPYYYDVVTNTYSNSFLSPTCDTCTRFISSDPAHAESIATTSSRYFTLNYYISSDDVATYTDIYLDYNFQHSLYIPYLVNDYSLYQYDETRTISTAGEFNSYFAINPVVPGTYFNTATLYGYTEPAWWQIFSDPQKVVLATFNSTFFGAGQMTTQDEYDEQERIGEQNMYFISTDDSPCKQVNDIACWFSQLGNKILHGAPIGYATRIYEIFSATTTTTSTLAMSLTFPTTSPAYGKTLTIDLAGAVQNAIATYEQPVSTFDDTPWDTFMTYWRYFWYILLAFWIISQIYGLNIFHVNDIRNNDKQTEIRTINTRHGKIISTKRL